jgi:hypothetical protein
VIGTAFGPLNCSTYSSRDQIETSQPMSDGRYFQSRLMTTRINGICAASMPGEPTFSSHIASPYSFLTLDQRVETSRAGEDAYKRELVLVHPQAQASQYLVTALLYRLHLNPNMKFSALSLLLVASASAVDAQIKTISAVRCFTKLGPSSTAKVATVSRVLTIPLYAQKKRTVTPTKVITPPPVLTTTTG